MRQFLIVLAGIISLGWAPLAVAQSSQTLEACSALERPNIDCVCVARRVATFERVAVNDQARALITEGYRYSLGLDNTYEQTLETSFQDPMMMMAAEQSFDTIGGRPGNIDDYERACVISGAEQPALVAAPSWSFVERYVDQCTLSTSNRRVCECGAQRTAGHLTEREFEAYYRSFSDYSDPGATSSSDMAAARGQAMGLSGEAFDALQARARAKFGPFADRDERYCSAMTFADQVIGFSTAERERAGFEEGAAMMLAPQQATPPTDTPLSDMQLNREMIGKSCTADGNSAQYCQCYMQDFESKIVAASPSDSVTRAWVLMTAGGALEPMTYMQMTQAVPQADHQSAALLMMQATDVGESCSQGMSTADQPIQGTPFERMKQICIAENEDEALCDCTVSQMQSKLSEDDFELIVDIREAEFKGAEDPLTVVANERGLSATEAEEAIAMNSAMMSGMMSMDVMACFGELPTGLSLPFPMPRPGQQ